MSGLASAEAAASANGAQPSASSASDVVPHAAAAWETWRRLGAPKFHVAPMVDQSELPFRMLCRKYGATAAYTPMFHARLFVESASYREEQFSSCAADRPLFVQFCANDPDTLVAAARRVEGHCDYVDLNFGCPQRIAKRGNYGAFLMDDLPRVEALVSTLHKNISTPVSAKIRIFPELERTIAYARMVERAGASLVAVHGRTREQKRACEVRADWDAIKAVKEALQIPVLGNGNIRDRGDVLRMMEYTGVDGVMSAESLLEDPALFWVERAAGRPFTHMERFTVAEEYLELCEQFPVPIRMVRGHMHKFVGPWFQDFTEIRNRFNQRRSLDIAYCKEIVAELRAAVAAAGRTEPVPSLSERALARLAREEALASAVKEQAREEAALAALARPAGGAATVDAVAGGGPAPGAAEPAAASSGAAAAQAEPANGTAADGGDDQPAERERGGLEDGPPLKRTKRPVVCS